MNKPPPQLYLVLAIGRGSLSGNLNLPAALGRNLIRIGVEQDHAYE
ncbi:MULTISPECIES: hypothetical protein [Cyclobacterium]|uniref:Uncharacterized protein n=1 Tax=Cyclobacterium plantarum TaxID=2716263 RepID=A0ABX0H4K3_9BACT|nr:MULTISPECIES: hypothetical protein [Cyclobacterium]NHE56427.1 hypothetical protein [Cyclobacterium plantarum]